MRYLTRDEADAHLSKIGMKVGSWNEITDIDSRRHETWQWVNRRAPAEAHESYVFSQHLAAWIPSGEWKILQIDNSTALDPVQNALISSLLFGPREVANMLERRSFLFEFTGDATLDTHSELLICNLIFSLLLFEAHVQIISSFDQGERYLSLQDGFAYLFARDIKQSSAEAVFKAFAETPGASPSWIQEIVSREQERALGSI
jgi:hypothetical protein